VAQTGISTLLIAKRIEEHTERAEVEVLVARDAVDARLPPPVLVVAASSNNGQFS
jgi:hypothetical protein